MPIKTVLRVALSFGYKGNIFWTKNYGSCIETLLKMFISKYCTVLFIYFLGKFTTPYLITILE